MIKHPRDIEGYEGSLAQLAKDVGNMQYDQTASFIEELADDITRQADADLGRGNSKLADKLYATANKLYEARDEMTKAWKICEPYMTNQQPTTNN